eukprot:scaffold364_cov401-Prasinococcus_capsulatus_cf.AAC.12
MLAAKTAANPCPSDDIRRSASTLRDPGSSWIAVGTSSSAAKLVVYLRRLGAESFSVSPVSSIAARTPCISTVLRAHHCKRTETRMQPTLNARSTVAPSTAMNPMSTKFNSPTEAIHAPPTVGTRATYVHGASMRPCIQRIILFYEPNARVAPRGSCSQPGV